ncbi:MAG: sigma-54-dependent transcriptional regulator [Kiritimatiellia bacterium]|jgi:DNA-binding NtrC family response regulator
MQTTFNILVIEDDPDGRRSVTDALESAGHRVVAAADGAAGLAELNGGEFDLVLSDVRLPDISGLEVLERIHRRMPELPVLLMTAYGTVATAVDALRAGAYDYILKPLDLTDLQSKVARAGETVRLRAEVGRLQSALSERRGRPLVFVSDAMRDVLERVRAVASTNATVLIVGESGVGKELIARELHFGGDRASAPLVAVNCGAFSESLLESELFGHEKGAFTGAAERHPGAFERAQGGTLFLDEIGIAPPRVQERLLRVLEEKEVTRVGGRQSVRLDVRILAATNQDLHDLVMQRRFRQDLMYRLQVVTIVVPPLRERPADVRPLADHFIAAACAEYRRNIAEVAADYYTRLEQYAWPGNVRELKHAVEASVLMAARPRLTAADLQLVGGPPAADEPATIPPGLTMAEIERTALLQSLRRHQGRRAAVAAELGLAVRTIQRKIRDYDLPF